MSKLCVNIDHVATIRQARMTVEPDPILAAREAILGGADGITLHIREDRRHMQNDDLFRLKETISVPLNLELARTPEMLALACQALPDMVMVVPEGREEITTEGGLDVIAEFVSLQEFVAKIKENGMPISAFIDADSSQIDAAKACGFTVCEIHTGPYAEAVIRNDCSLEHPEVAREQQRVSDAVACVLDKGMQCNAGHGLTHFNVAGIASIPGISELHIGHSIVSRSIFIGIRQSVTEMKTNIENAQHD
jgi:pyridoxine 5-phosphate synthase